MAQRVGCPGLGISTAHGSGYVPRQVTLIEINVKSVLFDLYEKYVGRIVFHRGLGLKQARATSAAQTASIRRNER